jgi:hypothetical protein
MGEFKGDLSKAQATKAKKRGMINCRSLKRRRRKAGEVPDIKTAVQNHCRECMGFTADDMPSLRAAVDACTAFECWLWCYRLGSLDEAAQAK